MKGLGKREMFRGQISVRGKFRGQQAKMNSKKALKPLRLQGFRLAEKEGFEPSRPFRGLHDFQSCALDQLGDFSIRILTKFRPRFPGKEQ